MRDSRRRDLKRVGVVVLHCGLEGRHGLESGGPAAVRGGNTPPIPPPTPSYSAADFGDADLEEASASAGDGRLQILFAK